MYNILEEWTNDNDYDDDSDDAEEFLDFASDMIDEKICNFVYNKTTDQQQSYYWDDMMIGRIPASLAHAATYKTKFCSQEEDEDTAHYILGYEVFEDTPAEYRRQNLQDKIIAKVSSQLRKPLDKSGLILHWDYPALAATPDATGDNFVVEIKCPLYDHTVRDYIHPNNNLTNRSYLEMQLEMLLDGSDKGYFCLASPDFESTNKVTIISVDFDKKYAENMARQATSFWCENVFPELMNNLFE